MFRRAGSQIAFDFDHLSGDSTGAFVVGEEKHDFRDNACIGTPISITVEGANILKRSMITFGQGAIRYRPYAYLELKARHFVGKGSSCGENITEEEAKVLEQTNLAREEADKVDSFSLKEFKASLMEVAVASDSKGHAAG